MRNFFECSRKFYKISILVSTNQMAQNWNEPLPLMDACMINRMIAKTDEYLSLVQWRNDGTAENLKEAVALAKNGQDIGLEATLALRPTDAIFAHWMDWSALVTYLFNRDTEFKTLLSAIRKLCTRK